MHRWYDYITVNIYYLGLSTLTQTTGIIYPLLVQKYIGEGSQGTAYGTLRLWTLMVALLVQSVVGMLSDRHNSPWGKRRPFILVGTMANLLFIASIGMILGLGDPGAFWVLFAIAILVQIATNTAQGAQQGLIPDLVAPEKRGRFSAFKALFELPIALLLVAFTTARLIAGGDFRAALLVTILVLAATMGVTMLVKEKPAELPPSPVDWEPFTRLLLMSAVFTAVILCMGKFVNWLGHLLSQGGPSLQQAIIMGLVGLFAILLAVGLGVWGSVRVGIGASTERDASFSWWVINRLAFLVGVINLSTFAIYYIQARLGMPGESVARPASLMLLLVGIFILISAIPAGWLADRYGHKRLIAMSGLLAALGTAICLALPNLGLIYLGGSLIGLATGVFYTANWALGTSLVPQEQAGRYLGVSNLAGAGAGAVGAYIGGPVADITTRMVPQMPGFGYIVLFSIYGLMILFSILALARVKSPVTVQLARSL